MAASTKKSNSAKSALTSSKVASKAISTAVRNSALPPKSFTAAIVAAPKSISREQIAVRAFEISQSARAGSETDNWLLAEKELSSI